jgi:hypothetical protein
MALNFVSTYGWEVREVGKVSDAYWTLNELRVRGPFTVVSLRQIIESHGRYSCFPRYFFEGDRSRLAASLAGAVLFYGARGLLRPDWSTSDILLNAEDQDVKSESLKNPFMLFPLTESLVPTPSTQQSQSEGQFGMRNSWLYALGMMLLEILLNAPLDSYRENAGETKVQIAWRVEKLAMQHGGPRWDAIISRCLHCPFPEHPDLSNPAFIQRVYREILQPLLAFNKLPSISDYTPRSLPTQSVTPPASSGYASMIESRWPTYSVNEL